MLTNVLDTVNIPVHNDSYVYRDFNDIGDMAYDAEAINNGIKNVLLTRKGSVAGNPSYGSGIHKIAFSHLDYITESSLELTIRSTINTWETRILLDEIKISKVDEYNQIIAEISYTYVDNAISISGEVTVPIEDL